MNNITVDTLLLNKKNAACKRREEIEAIAKAALACESKSVEAALLDCSVAAEDVSCCGISPGMMSRLFGRTRTKVSTRDQMMSHSFQSASAQPTSTTTQKLEQQIASLQKRAQSRREEAVALFRKGDVNSKKAAMRLLQKAKAAERSVASLEGTLDTMEMQEDLKIQTLLSQEVASALGKNSKSMLKKGKQTLVQTEGAVDEARDVMDLAEDVASAMDGLRPSVGTGGVDEDELLQELEQLCKPEAQRDQSNSAEEERQLHSIALPGVPTGPATSVAGPAVGGISENKANQAKGQEAC